MKFSSYPSVLLIALLAPTVLAQAGTAKKPAPQPAVKKASASKPPASGPVSLGNGIFMLGEEGSALPAPPIFHSAPVAKTAASVGKTNLTGLRLVSFCRSYLGRKLGNGQCTELAVYGLPASGANMYGNYQWGSIVCGYDITNGQQTIFVGPAGKVPGNPRRANIEPGDIIQYEGANFESHFTNGFTRNSYPHHTAIIEGVSADGRVFRVLEQNVNETQIVVESTVNLNEMTTGLLRIWRPVPAR